MKEYEENWDRLDEDTRKSILDRKEWLQRYEASLLRSSDRLPEIDSETITLVWDVEEEPGTKDPWSVIRCGNTVIWQELAGWGNYWRYPVIAKIFIEKYGTRLLGLELTSGSEYNLKWDCPTFEIIEIEKEIMNVKMIMKASCDVHQHYADVSRR